MRDRLKIIVLISLAALIIASLIFMAAREHRKEQYLKEPRIVKMNDERMLVIMAKGDPAKVAGGAFSQLYKIYHELPSVKKSSAAPIPRVRWSKPLGAPKEEWVGIYGLTVPASIVKLPENIKSSNPLAGITTWRYGGETAQILHAGPYSEEGPTIARLKYFIENSGYTIAGNYEEEYIKGPGVKSAGNPAGYRTMLRFSVKKK